MAKTRADDPRNIAVTGTAGMPGFVQAALQTLPSIKTPIQLAGFVFALFAGTLIYRANPDNVKSLVVVGAIAVALLVVPLSFHASMLRHIVEGQRAWFLLAMVALLLSAFGALAYVTVDAIGLSPTGSRFDSRLLEDRTRLIGDDKVELTWELFSLTKRRADSGSAFIGIVVLHDEDKIHEQGMGHVTSASCDQVQSCLGSNLLSDLGARPIFVPGTAAGALYTTTVSIKAKPKRLRVWWEFYQHEGEDGSTCGVNRERVGPPGGIPPLAMYDTRGQKVADKCYESIGQDILLITQ